MGSTPRVSTSFNGVFCYESRELPKWQSPFFHHGAHLGQLFSQSSHIPQEILECETPIEGVVQIPLVVLLFAELQSPLDQIGQILQLHAVLLDQIACCDEILWVGQHELPGKGAKILRNWLRRRVVLYW